MSRRVGATTGGPRQRCMMRNCGKWEFVKGLCKECSKSAASIAHLVNKNWDEYKNKAPIAVNMVVITERPDGHFIELKEGEHVHILEYVTDQPDLCIVRTAAEKIGYYATSAMKTEEQIYREFTMEEDVQLILELEQQEEVERQREAQFEENLRQKMKQKVEADRLRRLEEAEERKREAERLLEELEQKKAWEAEQDRAAREARQAKNQKDAEERKWREAQLRKHATAVREADERSAEARLSKKMQEQAAWERSEAERKDKVECMHACMSLDDQEQLRRGCRRGAPRLACWCSESQHQRGIACDE
eukprot:m.1291131 g.1291131  ORF g.1291131 m.1291131 type:complete len:305 (-) comp24785_c1_seq1:6320-7234(-)